MPADIDDGDIYESYEEEEGEETEYGPVRANYTAAVMAMTNDGRIRWQMTLQGHNTKGTHNVDKCMGIAFNDVTRETVVLLTATGHELR